MLNQWDQPLWCGYSITEKAGDTRWGWCFPWEDFGRHTTTVRSVWRVIAQPISYITLTEEAFWRSSSPQHTSRPEDSRKFAYDHQQWPSATRPRQPQDWLPILSSPRVGCDDRQLSPGPSGCWFPLGYDRKRFSSWIPPPATGLHSDWGQFLLLGDHYNCTVLIWGVLNYPVHPKWTVWMHTRWNCAVREGSRQCWHHIK